MNYNKYFDKFKERYKDQIEKQKLNNIDELTKRALDYADKTILEEEDRKGFHKSKIRVAIDILTDEIIYKKESFFNNLHLLEYY